MHEFAIQAEKLGDAAGAVAALSQLAGDRAPVGRDGLITLHVPDEERVTAAARSLDEAGIPVSHLAVRVPSLDEAFPAITGTTRPTSPRRHWRAAR